MNNERKKILPIMDFWIGLIVGFVVALIIMSLVLGLVISHYKNKEMKEYAQRQIELRELQEDYINRDSVEFLEIPGVRRAADGATADFDRKLDGILQRFRNRDID